MESAGIALIFEIPNNCCSWKTYSSLLNNRVVTDYYANIHKRPPVQSEYVPLPAILVTQNKATVLCMRALEYPNIPNR